ncbi:MAG: hypothetical protein NTZ73_01285 [Candidatus Diapherotrites archaeon]|nr:hypothetical protein [Candidatus Diapherotrites archaeon]
MNQRGQAFSVFELMIAAIIAVAILFVLLPIINNLITPTGSARDNIANTLNAVKNGGSQTSQDFALKKDETLTSKQFQKEGFDPHSVIFAKITSIDDAIIDIPDTFSNGFSQFVYKQAVQMKAKATVYCESTGLSLEETLEPLVSSGLDYYAPGTPVDLCTEGDYQPCCIVILKRA